MSISLLKPNQATYEETLLEYIDSLTEEERDAKVSDVLLIGVGEGDVPFFSFPKGNKKIIEIIGLLEELKYYLITVDVQGE